jgi:hypothetical protein
MFSDTREQGMQVANMELVESLHQFITIWRLIGKRFPQVDGTDRPGLAISWPNNGYPPCNPFGGSQELALLSESREQEPAIEDAELNCDRQCLGCREAPQLSVRSAPIDKRPLVMVARSYQNIVFALLEVAGTGCKTSQCSTILPSTSNRKMSTPAVS